jgi:hypothetical protein
MRIAGSVVVVAPPLLPATLAFHRLLPRPVGWLVSGSGTRRSRPG